MPLFTAIGVALGATVAASATGIGAFGVGLGATALAASTIGSSVYGMSQARRNMPAIPNIEAPRVEDAAAKATALAKEKQRAMARSKTVYTSPLGIQTEAATAKKYLLGM